MLKFVKFGFGQCMDQACYDIREEVMSRNEAIELVLKYDGKCSNEYIQEFCDYIEITVDEFWSTVEKFRGNMWKKDNSGELKNCIWEELKKRINFLT